MALQQGQRGQGSNWLWATVTMTVTVLLAAGGLACTGPTDEKLPPTVQDPATLKTPSGAMARYWSALAGLPGVFDTLFTMTGVLTDELAALPAPVGVGSSYTGIDSRQDLSDFAGLYNQLHHLRGQVREARGFVAAYAPDSSPALAGHLYALEAYADVFLADVFCSGIPLSTVDFDGDYTLQPGSTTATVYERAVGLFDSALAVASDSARVQHLAAVGKGRALLALGRYAEAAAAVAGVPDGYQYQVVFAPLPNSLLEAFARPGVFGGGYQQFAATPSMSNNEGTNGLDYRTSGDPRTIATALSGNDPNNNTYWFPTTRHHYPVSGNVTLTVADAIEARLIEAEAALHAGDATTWRNKLNQLRTVQVTLAPDTLYDTLGVSGCRDYPDYCGGPNGPESTDASAGQPVGGFAPSGYSLVDSFPINPPLSQDIVSKCYNLSWYTPCWSADGYTMVYIYTRPGQQVTQPGTGGVAGLDTLPDPGTPEGRMDLQFRERAFWLYLTGHRQGDLRRLVREYLRDPTTVYPTGAYSGGSGAYGTQMVAPIPTSEQELNSQYTGCLHLGA